MPQPLTNRTKKKVLSSNIIEVLREEEDFTEVIPAENINAMMQDLLNLAQKDTSKFPLCQVAVMDSAVVQTPDDFIGETKWDLPAILRCASVFDSETEAIEWAQDTSDLLEYILLHNTLLGTVEDLEDITSETDVVPFPVGTSIRYLAGFVTTLHLSPLVSDE